MVASKSDRHDRAGKIASDASVATSLGRTIDGVSRVKGSPFTKSVRGPLRSSHWLTAIAGILVAAVWLYARTFNNSQGARATAPPTIPVGVALATKGDFVATLAGLGTVTPLATVSVKTQIAGRLVRIGFEEGQMVKEGDFLVEIDPRPYRHALQQAQGQLTRDQALLKNAELDLDRYKRLGKGNFISRQQIDTQESLVQQYRANVQIDDAQVKTAQLNLDYCDIMAPVSGRVGLRLVDLGNYLQAGDSNALVVLTQLQPITVVFPVAEDHLPRVMKQIADGKKLAVTAYDRSGRTRIAEGVLATTDNQVDPATGTVKFKAKFDNRELALFPNQFVNVRLAIETIRNATIIPTSGVQHDPKGTFVYVVSSDDTAVMRSVDVGQAEGEKTVILSGVEAGVRIVVAGADRLRDGAKVRALQE